MTQEDRWETQWEHIMEYMKQHKCRPSKHRIEDHKMLNWIKYNKKLQAKGKLPEHRLQQFNQLLEEADKYRKVNQFAYLSPSEASPAGESLLMTYF